MKNCIVAYVPVLHAGYIGFFKKHPGPIFLIGRNFLEDFPKLERDIRALPEPEMKKAIEALGVSVEVVVLDAKNLTVLKGANLQISMPDEDISHDFAKKYLKGVRPVFESVFLRWNRKISDTEFEVAPDRIISESLLDREFMKKAEKEAEKSSDWWRPIGAIAVKNKKRLFVAHNRHMPTDYHLATFGDPRASFDAGERPDVYTSIHAEATVVASAARAGKSLKGASIYSTTFPCPNCARLLAEAGVKKVYYRKGYSLRDAEVILKSAKIEVILVK